MNGMLIFAIITITLALLFFIQLEFLEKENQKF